MPPERDRDIGSPERALRSTIQVIAVHADVEAAPRHRRTLDLLENPCKPFGQRDSAGLDPEQDNVVRTSIAFQDLVCDPPNGSLDVAGVHHERHRNHLRT